MQNETDKAAGTHEAPPTDANFQTRFAAELETWRASGCPVLVDVKDGGNAMAPCGCPPHRTKILPKDEAGDVTMSVDCNAGHEAVWSFKVPEAEMKAELKRQADAARTAEANGGKKMDPMIAKVSISLDLRTQEVKIEPWVATPGLGIQLAGMLMSHFFAQLQQMAQGPAAPAGALKLPVKGIIHPKTGRLVS